MIVAETRHSWFMTETLGRPRTETQSIESEATGAAVIAPLADAARIPEWGRGRPPLWLACHRNGRDFALRVAVDEGAGTVDYLREVAPGREGGAYIRAAPRPGGGSVVIMTLPLLPDVDPADTAATLARELTGLVSLIKRS